MKKKYMRMPQVTVTRFDAKKMLKFFSATSKALESLTIEERRRIANSLHALYGGPK